MTQMCPQCGQDNRDTARFCAHCQAQLQGLLGSHTMLQNRYEVTGVLGCGGMGAVYLALDHRLGQNPVAVKENFDVSPPAQAQFHREAAVLARLSHPHLPKVIDHFVEPGGRQYLVMEYVGGDNLQTILERRGALPEAEVLPWADALLDALIYLHGQPQPVFHRDIKPSNIKITPQGQVKLVDFGLVKLWDPANPRTQTVIRGLGTAGYTPLEQYDGTPGHTDARSDIYALGATLYHALAGQAPPTATRRAVDPTALAPLRQWSPAVSPRTEAAIMRALELQPAARFQSAAEMRAALTGLSPASAQPPAYAPPPAPAQPPAYYVPPPTPATPPAPAGKGGWGVRFWAAAGTALLAVALVVVCLFALLCGVLAPKETPTQIARAATSTPATGSTPTALPATITWQKDGKTMVLVPAGEFLMGSTDADTDADSDEKPQHKVYLDAFYIDQTEVTNAEYKRFVDATGHRAPDHWTNGQIPAGLENHPVVYVSWEDANAYAQWAGKRLPTEAEWEKAARGTDGRIYPWGNTWDSAKCNSGDGGPGKTTPVGSYPAGASPYGALDLAGNVWEWCADWYGEGYYQTSPANNPRGPDSGSYRVLRGGSWIINRGDIRAADRLRFDPGLRDYNLGFRCCLSPTSSL